MNAGGAPNTCKSNAGLLESYHNEASRKMSGSIS